MPSYRVQQFKTREDSFEGSMPLQTRRCTRRSTAREAMVEMHQRGLFYACIYDGDGECIDELIREEDAQE